MVTSVVVLSLTLYKAFSRDAPEQVLTPVVGIKVKCWLYKRFMIMKLYFQSFVINASVLFSSPHQ